MKAGLPLIVALAGIVTAGAPLRSQQPPPSPTFRGGVELVQLDVAVLDRNRRPVPNLTAADFTILEDGKPRPIVAFQELTAPDPDGSLVPWMREVAPDVRSNSAEGLRLFLLVLDDVSVAGPVDELAVVDNVKTIARAFIDRMGPLDQACVLFTGDNRQSLDFTGDRQALLASVNKFHGTAVPGILRAIYPASVVKRAAESMIAASHRRKAMIYIGNGLRVAVDPGETFAQIGVNTGGMQGVQQQAVTEAQQAIAQAQRANVSIYTVNPRGLEAYGDDASRTAINSANDALESVANVTGGFAVTNTNSFSAQVAQIFRETGTYYLIGYQSAFTDSKFHRVKVELRQPGFNVRARNAVQAIRPENRKPAPAVFKAIAGILPNPEMYMRTALASFGVAERPGAAGLKMGAVTIALGLSQPASRERVSHVIDLIATAFTREGKPIAHRRQTARLTLRPSEGDARYEILSRLDLKPGRYQLRFATHNAALDKSGSVYVDVEVPDFAKDKLSLSGVVLAANPALPAAGADLLGGVTPVTPTTQRSFSATDKVTVFLRAYQGGDKQPRPVAVRASIRDDRDSVVFRSDIPLEPGAFTATRQADIRFPLPLATLKPGPHLLTVEALVDEKAAATRQVRLTIRE